MRVVVPPFFSSYFIAVLTFVVPVARFHFSPQRELGTSPQNCVFLISLRAYESCCLAPFRLSEGRQFKNSVVERA